MKLDPEVIMRIAYERIVSKGIAGTTHTYVVIKYVDRKEMHSAFVTLANLGLIHENPVGSGFYVAFVCEQDEQRFQAWAQERGLVHPSRIRRGIKIEGLCH